MADLSVTFVGKKLRSPLGVASHAVLNAGVKDAQAETDHLKHYADIAVGYVHTPFICTEEEHPRDKPPAWKFMNIRSRDPFAMEGLLVTTEAARIMCRLNPGLAMIAQLRENLPDDVAVIANMIGPGADPKGWAAHCKKAEDAGADIIEMNVSCPIPATEARSVHAYQCGEMCDAAGCLLGDSPALLIPVVKAVVESVNIPVGVKLTPETGFPRVIGLAEAIKDAGADFITSINAPITCGPPDIYNGGQGQWPGITANPICAALGPWDRFLLYRNLGVLSAFVPGIELAGVGGLVEPEHIVESMMLGARICEFSSGLLWKGTGLIAQSIKFLNNYMDEMGYTRVEDFIGLGVPHIQPVETLDWRQEDFLAVTDEETCNLCGRCARSICMARTIEKDPPRIALDSRYCIGCGLCQAICPENAVRIVAEKHPVVGVSLDR